MRKQCYHMVNMLLHGSHGSEAFILDWVADVGSVDQPLLFSSFVASFLFENILFVNI